MKGFRFFIIALLLILIVVGSIGLILSRPKKTDDTVIIILSPHYDDAVLSLGGFLAKHTHPSVVATFFTGEPALATSTPWDKQSGFSTSKEAIAARVKENNAALRMVGAEVKDFGYRDFQYRDHATSSEEQLEQDVAQDIQALIASYGDKNVEVYAPSLFTSAITHPDHALLHRAFKDVYENYPKKNISFYSYEDYPYVQEFNKESKISLEKNLENDTGRIFDTQSIVLTSKNVHTKESSLEKYASQSKAFAVSSIDIVKSSTEYTNNRCGTNVPCEVVYKLFRITD